MLSSFLRGLPDAPKPTNLICKEGTGMKIKNITEPQKFFEVLKQCKGKVELVTSEGDRLNLKSTLCQYIALTQMFKDAQIDELDLIVSEPEDLNLLLNYLVRG
jgi:hypothetical protein